MYGLTVFSTDENKLDIKNNPTLAYDLRNNKVFWGCFPKFVKIKSAYNGVIVDKYEEESFSSIINGSHKIF